MPHSDNQQSWRGRLGWLTGQLLVVFAGVSAAFLVENYRDAKSQTAEMHQAVAGIVTELTHYEIRSKEYANAIMVSIERWAEADRAGKRAIPGYYRIPGATHPPSAAWNAAVASGTARLIEPNLRMELGYFYSEFVGIHDNYTRYNQFTEGEVLPRISLGPDAFYGPDGHLLPAFRVHMELQSEFARDLRRLGTKAHELRLQLQALAPPRT